MRSYLDGGNKTTFVQLKEWIKPVQLKGLAKTKNRTNVGNLIISNEPTQTLTFSDGNDIFVAAISAEMPENGLNISVRIPFFLRYLRRFFPFIMQPV